MNWHIFFIIAGTFIIIVLKHSGRSEVESAFLYWLFQFGLILLIADALSGNDTFGLWGKLGIYQIEWFDLSKLGYTDLDLNRMKTFVLIIGAILFGILRFLQLSQILKTKKYKLLTFLRLVSFPIEAGLIVLFIVAVSPASRFIRDFGLVLLLLYLIYFSIQKRLLIHLKSLPRE